MEAVRRSKIICTLGPSSWEEDMLKRLHSVGMNVCRINMSHSNPDKLKELTTRIRSVIPTAAVLLDTKGPEVRTSDVRSSKVMINTGDEVIIQSGDEHTTGQEIYVNLESFQERVPDGSKIFLDDGKIELKVVKIFKDRLNCKVISGGFIKSKRSVNVPGVNLGMPALTAKDKEDLRAGCELGVDFIAASFVNTKSDVEEIRAFLKEHGGDTIKIISKIESKSAVDDFDGILEASDGIMVARGDLGVEIPGEYVPIVQKNIIKKANKLGKPIVVATQMLESMIQSPVPTRAETSDIANAVLDGADCLMLSGETTVGSYPENAVATLVRVSKYIESVADYKQINDYGKFEGLADGVCHGAIVAANELSLDAIIVPTASGNTACRISKYRCRVPMYATTFNQKVCRQLNIAWGIEAHFVDKEENSKQLINASVKHLISLGRLNLDHKVALVAGLPVGQSIVGTNTLLLGTVRQILTMV